MKSMKNVTK